MPAIEKTWIKKRKPKQVQPVPLMPEDLAVLKQIEKERKERADQIRKKQEKLQIVPGPVALDWTIDPDEEDLLYAIDSIKKLQWKDIPEGKEISRRDRAEVYQYRKMLPPLVMITHLHAVFLNDSTFVEREIRSCCQSHQLRRLMVNLIDGGELVILADDYYRILNEWKDDANREAFELFEELLKEMPEATSLAVEDLEVMPMLAKQKGHLLTAGFLTLKTGQSNTFNISIPNIGLYLKLVTSSRKWIVRTLDKVAWHEMSESMLSERWDSGKTQWKEFKGAKVEWSLCDCYGGGWCEPFNTPVGRGWKITGKK